MSSRESSGVRIERLKAFGLVQAHKLKRRLQYGLTEIGFGDDNEDSNPQSYDEDPARITAKIGSDDPTVECKIVRDLFMDYYLEHCSQQEEERLELHVENCTECLELFYFTGQIITKLMFDDSDE